MRAPAAGHIDSYYSRTVGDPPARKALDRPIEADVAIIGGGLAGLTTAVELQRRGRSVVLLEANRIAWGASGRNGGFVGPGWALGLDKLRAKLGEDQARSLYRLSLEGVAIVRENLASMGLAAIALTNGKLSVIRYDDAAGLEAQRALMAREFGRELELVPTERLRGLLRSERYHQALFDPGSFHFHPLAYAEGLATAIEAGGGRIFEGTPALAIDSSSAGRSVRAANGTVLAKDIVVATGGYTAGLLPALDRAHLPIATYVLLTAPAREAIEAAIATPYAISDNRRAGDYYRRVEGGERLLWGGRITTRVSEPGDLARLLHRTMVSTYPQLAGVPVDLAWSGLMSYARHQFPLLGRLEEGLWYAYGFGGHGLNTTAIGGRVIAEAITGETDRLRLFSPFGLAWTGGPVGKVAAQLHYWRLQHLDRWRERGSAESS